MHDTLKSSETLEPESPRAAFEAAAKAAGIYVNDFQRFTEAGAAHHNSKFGDIQQVAVGDYISDVLQASWLVAQRLTPRSAVPVVADRVQGDFTMMRAHASVIVTNICQHASNKHTMTGWLDDACTSAEILQQWLEKQAAQVPDEARPPYGWDCDGVLVKTKATRDSFEKAGVVPIALFVAPPSADAEPVAADMAPGAQVAALMYRDELPAAQAGDAWIQPFSSEADKVLYTPDQGAQAPRVKWCAYFDSHDRRRAAYLLTRDAKNWTQLTKVVAAERATTNMTKGEVPPAIQINNAAAILAHPDTSQPLRQLALDALKAVAQQLVAPSLAVDDLRGALLRNTVAVLANPDTSQTRQRQVLDALKVVGPRLDIAGETTVEWLHALAAHHLLALVPLHVTREMQQVMDEEGWQWEDLLAAAAAITEEQYADIQAGPDAAQRRVEQLEALLAMPAPRSQESATHSLTDAELGDPEYMKAYIDSVNESFAQVLAENKVLRAKVDQDEALDRPEAVSANPYDFASLYERARTRTLGTAEAAFSMAPGGRYERDYMNFEVTGFWLAVKAGLLPSLAEGAVLCAIAGNQGAPKKSQVWADFRELPNVPDGLYAQVRHFLLGTGEGEGQSTSSGAAQQRQPAR